MPALEHLSCPNSPCPDAGRRGHGNLTFRGSSGQGKRIGMVSGRPCKARFSERKGTVLEQSRLAEEKVRDVLDHRREGCGTRATRRLVTVDKNTVTRYRALAGTQAEALHDELVAFAPSDPRSPSG